MSDSKTSESTLCVDPEFRNSRFVAQKKERERRGQPREDDRRGNLVSLFVWKKVFRVYQVANIVPNDDMDNEEGEAERALVSHFETKAVESQKSPVVDRHLSRLQSGDRSTDLLANQMETPNDLSFKSDPGAVRHGNFINYYQFHGAQQRLNAFPDTIKDHLKVASPTYPLYALDLGCNTGEITQGLYTLLKGFHLSDNVRILGIDIDPQLIRRAEESNTHSNAIQYLSGNLIEMLASAEKLQSEFTNGLNFHLVTCLSLTMWLHLNNGDAGLQAFLEHTAAISEVLVVEPQRWKSYKDAVRRMKRGAGVEEAFPHFRTLQWRETVEQDIEQFLQSDKCNMVLIHKSPPSSWGRTISVYVKRDKSRERN